MFGLLDDSAHLHLAFSRRVFVGELLDMCHHRWRLYFCCVMEGINIATRVMPRCTDSAGKLANRQISSRVLEVPMDR